MSYDGTGNEIWKVPEFMKRGDTDQASNSRLIDGLCWQTVACVTEEGWYWVADGASAEIAYIREYSGKWCRHNWEIDNKLKYAGPIPQPT